ncbi:MAG: Crp/Fnr family transcriptional regulator [Bacteroidota bacterium]
MKSYLQALDLFSSPEINDLLALGTEKRYQKGAYLIQEGQVCQEVAFVKAGIFRSYYHSSTAEEVTYCLTFPDQLLAAYSSYLTGKSSLENIQAITEAEVIRFAKAELEAFMAASPNGVQFAKLIAEQQYLEMEKRIFQLQREPAEVRYETLLREHPEYLHQVPLQYIASYLGITQRHLSRLRRKLMKNETNVLPE